ncbi:MAG: DUF2961 domain-containing protein [Bacteroidales bacterium]|nr:DUF2961 domain-containing protein [Bacteroidales bacterium]
MAKERVKIYLDGDRGNPTLVGTGTEDYIGSGWGQENMLPATLVHCYRTGTMISMLSTDIISWIGLFSSGLQGDHTTNGKQFQGCYP